MTTSGSVDGLRQPFVYAVAPGRINAPGKLLVISNITYPIQPKEIQDLFPMDSYEEMAKKIEAYPLTGQETPIGWLHRLQNTRMFKLIAPVLDQWGGKRYHANANRDVEHSSRGHQKRAKDKDVWTLFRTLEERGHSPDAILTLGITARLAVEKYLNKEGLKIPIVSIRHTGGPVTHDELTTASNELRELWETVKLANTQSQVSVLPIHTRINTEKNKAGQPTVYVRRKRIDTATPSGNRARKQSKHHNTAPQPRPKNKAVLRRQREAKKNIAKDPQLSVYTTTPNVL